MTLPSGQTRRWLVLGVSALVALLALVAISSLPGQSPVVFGQTGTSPAPDPAPAPAPPPANVTAVIPNLGQGATTPAAQVPRSDTLPPGVSCNPATACSDAGPLLAAIPNRVPGAAGVVVSAAGTVVTLPVPAGAAGAQCALTTATGQQIRLPTTVNPNGTVSCTATQPGLVTLVAGAAAAAPAAPGAAPAPVAALPRTGDDTAGLARWGILGAAGLVVVGFGFGIVSRRLARKQS